MGMHLKVGIDGLDPTLIRRICKDYIPITTWRVGQADRSNYFPGIFAGGRTRGSSLIVPVGSLDVGALVVALFVGLVVAPLAASFGCALPACDFFAPAFALAGGVSTDCSP